MPSMRRCWRRERGALVGALVLAVLTACGSPEGGETRKRQASFGYSGSEGPSHWASLDPAWRMCSSGRAQSPVALKDAEPADLPEIDFHYRPAEVTVENNGHSLEVKYPPGSSIIIGGERHELKQFHFHSPSEHRVGRSFPLEFHLVHQTRDGGTAVLGVFVQEGRANRAMSQLTRAAPSEEGESLPLAGTTDASDLLPDAPASAERWSYTGSLTTPPCTEAVRWHVFGEPIEMSRQQIDRYMAVYRGNNRPVQPLNDRQIRFGR